MTSLLSTRLASASLRTALRSKRTPPNPSPFLIAATSSSSSSSCSSSVTQRSITTGIDTTAADPSSISKKSPYQHPAKRLFSTSSPTRHASCSSSSSSPSDHHQQQHQHSSSSSSNMAEKGISSYLSQSHERIFENNKKWADQKRAHDPEFFAKLSSGQTPEYLWIGCADSRIPAEAITGLEPGETFVHRNIANMVVNTDLNVMSVINYAVRHLGVKHIVVCGHYGCGGVKAAMTPKDLGLLNPWLRNIRDVYRLHEKELDGIKDEEERYNRLVELNVVEQCRNVVKTAAVQQSYKKNEYPIVHGWVFGFRDGLLTDLKVDFKQMLADVQKIYNLEE